MSSLTPTCDSNQLEALLECRLDAAQERHVMAHLGACERCRHELESRAAEPASWDEAKSYLTRREDEPAAHDDDIPRAGRTLQIQHVLNALAPTDDPEMLGRLGGYEVSGVVGTGGMGVVLKAFDRSLDRTVAIKVLAPHLASSGAARKRFAREAKAAAAVLHPNVMAIHSVSNGESLPYLVMPYLRGESLQKRLDHEGPLPVSEILRIGSQIASGLAAAHSQGLVHRDIKPANILLEDGVERVAITDFGLARAVDDATMTRTGVIAGTPQYMSPEQARGEAVDTRSDLFSMGSVLYTMCTGRPPFRAETSYGILRRITDTDPRPIREINPEIPDWLCAIIGKLMSKQAGNRYSSAGEVAELLADCLAHVQQPTTVPLPCSVEQMSQLLTNDTNSRHPEQLGQLFYKPRANARRLIALGAFACALLLAGIVIVLELNKGQLRIECEADDVPIRIMQDDEVVEKLNVFKSGKTVRIAAGNYRVEVDGDMDGIVVESGAVKLKRRGQETVKIVRSKGDGLATHDSQLDGTWELVGTLGDAGGAPATGQTWHIDTKAQTIRIDYTSPYPNLPSEVLMFTLDRSTTPKQLTTSATSPLRNAIYEIVGDTLRIAMFNRSDLGRPKAIDPNSTRPNNEEPLVGLEFKRAKLGSVTSSIKRATPDDNGEEIGRMDRSLAARRFAAQLRNAQLRRQRLLETFDAQHREVLKLDAEIQALMEQSKLATDAVWSTPLGRQALDKSVLPEASSDFKAETTITDGLVSSGGIIQRIEGDTIYLESGDHFKTQPNIPVMVLTRGPSPTRLSLDRDVLERGMAISYSLRDGKATQIVVTGIVKDPRSDVSAFETIRMLGLRKGSVLSTGHDPQYSIRLMGKDGEVEIKHGETKLIQLAKPVLSLEWRAGDFKPEGVEDFEPFDYLLVEFRENGRITFTCYATPPLPNAAKFNSISVDSARIVPLSDVQTNQRQRQVQLDRVLVEANVDLTGRSPGEFLGGPALVTFEFNRQTLSRQGIVSFVDPQANADGTIRVRVSVENEQVDGKWLLTPGDRVKLTIQTTHAPPGESASQYGFPSELEGSWRIAAVVTGGNARDDYAGQLAEIRGSSLTLRSKTAANTYSLMFAEPGDEHVALDLTAYPPGGTADRSVTFHCIMSIAENELRLCRPQRPSTNRPRSLDSPERSETVFTLVRDKDDSQRPFAVAWKQAESWLREKPAADQGANQAETRVHPAEHLPIWTRDGKRQYAGLLIRYLKTRIDPPSWENGTTSAVYDAASHSLRVHASPKNHEEIARTLESVVPIKMAMDDRPGVVRHAIGDMPLWSQDGKGQNVMLLGDYLQSVIGEPRPAFSPTDEGQSLVMHSEDASQQKQIADALNVLRVEMLLDDMATLERTRDSAGCVDLLTDDAVAQLARWMSEDGAVPENPREFVIDTLDTHAAGSPPGSDPEHSSIWVVVVDGDHAVATDSTNIRARMELSRVDGQWKISNLDSKTLRKRTNPAEEVPEGGGAMHGDEAGKVDYRLVELRLRDYILRYNQKCGRDGVATTCREARPVRGSLVPIPRIL